MPPCCKCQKFDFFLFFMVEQSDLAWVKGALFSLLLESKEATSLVLLLGQVVLVLVVVVVEAAVVGLVALVVTLVGTMLEGRQPAVAWVVASVENFVAVTDSTALLTKFGSSSKKQCVEFKIVLLPFFFTSSCLNQCLTSSSRKHFADWMSFGFTNIILDSSWIHFDMSSPLLCWNFFWSAWLRTHAMSRQACALSSVCSSTRMFLCWWEEWLRCSSSKGAKNKWKDFAFETSMKRSLISSAPLFCTIVAGRRTASRCWLPKMAKIVSFSNPVSLSPGHTVGEWQVYDSLVMFEFSQTVDKNVSKWKTRPK